MRRNTKRDILKNFLFSDSFFICQKCEKEPIFKSLHDDQIEYICNNHPQTQFKLKLEKMLAPQTSNIKQYTCCDHKEALYYCIICSEIVCDKCSKSKNKNCINHLRTYSLPVIQNCIYHKNKYSSKFCLTCNNPLCDNCKIHHTNGHIILDTKNRSNLLDSLFYQKEVIVEYEDYLNSIQNLFENNNEFKKIKKRIEQHLKINRRIINNFLEFEDNDISFYNLKTFPGVVPVYLNYYNDSEFNSDFQTSFLTLLYLSTIKEELRQYNNAKSRLNESKIRNIKQILTKNGPYYGNLIKEDSFGQLSFLSLSNFREIFKGTQIDGYGIKFYEEGIYIGFFFEGRRSGKGQFEYKNPQEEYYGEWKDDLKNGIGEYFYTNGDLYVGEWKDNQKNGFGIYNYKNKDIYEGEWKNGKMEGYGEYSMKGKEKYKGYFKEGYFVEGKYEINNDFYYEGEWNKGVRHGFGIISSKNKNKNFIVEFENDELCWSSKLLSKNKISSWGI